MKNLVMAFVLLFASVVHGQVSKISQLFDSFQNQEGVTSIKIAKPMFQLISQLNIDDEDLSKIKPLMSKISSLKILIVEKDAKSDKRFERLQTEISTALKNLKYEELISINSEDSKIKFLAESIESNVLNNLLLSINGEDETMFMILEGILSMDDISNLITNEEEK